jgi:hypothetical protein
MSNKTLHLTLKSQWFWMIYNGIKKEEYREIKDFWIKRLCVHKFNNLSFCDLCDCCYTKKHNKFDTITFSLGYAKDRKQFVIELKDIKMKTGNPEWGAENNINYFVLELGNILSSNFTLIENVSLWDEEIKQQAQARMERNSSVKPIIINL